MNYERGLVKNFPIENSRIQFLYLCSPNLNLIEQWWKFVKKKVTYILKEVEFAKLIYALKPIPIAIGTN